MTKLSININKISLLRNSRGRNFPDVRLFAERCLNLGAHGITMHLRPDQRHSRYTDVEEINLITVERRCELNVKGFPSVQFLDLVKRVRPVQCTLVPDGPDQLTSDHGWDLEKEAKFLGKVVGELKSLGIRASLFADFDSPYIEIAREVGADRIELYTDP
jgi:pyridoxine 5-phosphate synthase